MFKKMQQADYPPRLWALVGFPGSGKSTFAAQMRGPLLVVDADQRFEEVLPLAGEKDVYQLSDRAGDNTNAERISALLSENMPGSRVGTIVVDSLTTILAPLVTQAILDNDAGRNKNRMTAFKDKALAMRLLQDGISRWGTDTLWIYHLQRGRNAQAQAQVTPTVSLTELVRLTRSLNLQLEMVQDGQRRGVKVTWARRGRIPPDPLWDEEGFWQGMPERIEAAVYDGLSPAQQQALALQAPEVFTSPDKAIVWGFEQGVFQAIQHARNAYDKLKAEAQPQTAQEMRDLWIADIERRIGMPVFSAPDGDQGRAR